MPLERHGCLYLNPSCLFNQNKKKINIFNLELAISGNLTITTITTNPQTYLNIRIRIDINPILPGLELMLKIQL
jgi:hypothetical protein